MAKESDSKVKKWIAKLEQESWQMELLVSAFTIFLLIQGIGWFGEFLRGLMFEYDLSDSLLTFVFIFLSLLRLSIKALTVFLIVHLLLRGFWIGVIGLRSVQASIHFEELNYSKFFTEKLKKKVINLDQLVVFLDEICSLIFSFAFLIISMLLSFGMFLLFLGTMAISLQSLVDLSSGFFRTAFTFAGMISMLIMLIAGLIYFIDFFTLGFFKKFKWFSKIYYPFYRFYGFITLSGISKTTYYYFISKFSKKRIRIFYLIAGLIITINFLTEFNQYPFYPEQNNPHLMSSSQYDNLRAPEDYINDVSIQSNLIQDDFLQLFIRYNPKDNEMIQSNCPDFKPLKQNGFNWSKQFERSEGGLLLTDKSYENEDLETLKSCLSSFYQVSVNDQVVDDVKYYYYTHPAKKQKGLMAMIDISQLNRGAHILEVKMVFYNENSEKQIVNHARVPFWTN